MGKLGDILGDDFEEQYESKREQRREQARKVSKEVLMEIAYQAIKGGGFNGEEPRFRFDAGEIDHDVLLMESPDNDLQRFQWPLGDDAKTQGMFHLNQLFSCAFQENMLHLLDKIETGEYYMVVGRYQEKTQEDSGGNKETYYNINPVRGIVPLEVAKKYADQYEKQMDGASVEEQSKAQKEQSGGSSSDDSDVDLSGMGDDDGEVDRERIIEVFQAIGSDAPQVLEGVAEGDSDMIDKLISVTNNNLKKEAARERILDIFEEEVQEIPGRGDEEEDEDDGIDLGGIGGDDEDEDEEEESESEEEDDWEEDVEDDEEEEDDDDGGEEGVKDWF